MITADQEESQYRKDMLARIANRLGEPFEIKRALTDASSGSAVGIECKTPSDFISSIPDGRLFRQAHDIYDAYDRSMILVEGTLSDVLYARRGMSVSSVMGAIYSVAMRQHVPVQFTHPVKSGKFEIHLDAALRAGLKPGQPTAALVRKKTTPLDMALSILASFPGVGEKRALTILSRYKTLQRALQSVSGWDEIPGIGPKTVESCMELLNAQNLHPTQQKVTQ